MMDFVQKIYQLNNLPFIKSIMYTLGVKKN